MKKKYINFIIIAVAAILMTSCGTLERGMNEFIDFQHKVYRVQETCENYTRKYKYYVNQLPIEKTKAGTSVLYSNRPNNMVRTLEWSNATLKNYGSEVVLSYTDGTTYRMPCRLNKKYIYRVNSRSPYDGYNYELLLTVVTLGSGNNVTIRVSDGGNDIEYYAM